MCVFDFQAEFSVEAITRRKKTGSGSYNYALGIEVRGVRVTTTKQAPPAGPRRFRTAFLLCVLAGGAGGSLGSSASAGRIAGGVAAGAARVFASAIGRALSGALSSKGRRRHPAVGTSRRADIPIEIYRAPGSRTVAARVPENGTFTVAYVDRGESWALVVTDEGRYGWIRFEMLARHFRIRRRPQTTLHVGRFYEVANPIPIFEGPRVDRLIEWTSAGEPLLIVSVGPMARWFEVRTLGRIRGWVQYAALNRNAKPVGAASGRHRRARRRKGRTAGHRR